MKNNPSLYMNRALRREHRSVCRDLKGAVERLAKSLCEAHEFSKKMALNYAAHDPGAWEDARTATNIAGDLLVDPVLEQLNSLYYLMDSFPEDVR